MGNEVFGPPEDETGGAFPKAREVTICPEAKSKFPVIVQVGSKSNPDALPYDVSIFDDGSCVCTCKGYSYRRECRHCKEARVKVFGQEEPAKSAKPTEDEVARIALEDLLRT